MQKKKEIKVKKIVIILILLSLIGIFIIWRTIAYLTAYDKSSNVITVGEVNIVVQEPIWEAGIEEAKTTNPDANKPQYAENLLPMQTISKDPQIYNVGTNPAYVYLEITVPTGKTKLNGSEELTEIQLFTYEASSDWTLFKTKEEEEKKIYTYYYNEILNVNETTSKLFNEITFADVISGEGLDGINFDIDVKGYAIQSDYLPEGTDVEGAFDICIKSQN